MNYTPFSKSVVWCKVLEMGRTVKQDEDGDGKNKKKKNYNKGDYHPGKEGLNK